MSIDTYLAALDAKLREIEGLVASSSIQREIDANLSIGFIKGRITFVDGSTLDFSEQLPTERAKFRLHYMDAQNSLIARWDSAPHHKELSTSPFHKHTAQGAEEHRAITLLIGSLLAVNRAQGQGHSQRNGSLISRTSAVQLTFRSSSNNGAVSTRNALAACFKGVPGTKCQNWQASVRAKANTCAPPSGE